MFLSNKCCLGEHKRLLSTDIYILTCLGTVYLHMLSAKIAFSHITRFSVIFKLLTWWNGSDVFNSQARTESRSLFIKTFIEEFEYWKWYICVPLGGGHKKCRWRVQGSHHAGPGQCHIPDKQSGHIFAENLRCSDGSAKTDGVLRQLADFGELRLSLNRKHQNLLKSNASHY